MSKPKPRPVRKLLMLRATACFAISPAIVFAGMAIDDAPDESFLLDAAQPMLLLSLPALALGWAIAAAFPMTISRHPLIACGLFTFLGAIYGGFITRWSHVLCAITIGSVVAAGLALALWLHFFPLVEREPAEPVGELAPL